MVHKSWLAGLGAYDIGRENASIKFDQLFVDGSAFVNDLLEKGESIEMHIQAKLEARNMFKDKISALSALKAKFGFGNESRDQQIDTLSQRVDSLIEVVAKLSQHNTSESTAESTAQKKATTTAKTIKKAPAKTAVTSKTATKAAAKPAVAKPAAAKPAAAKPTAANPAAAKPAAAKPAAAKPAAAKPAAISVAVKPEADKND
jgi:hypothetical protein